MQEHAIWRSRPVFVTSTFRDMQAERDWLRDHVFPELEERLRARFHHLEPIDLRWGVDTAEVTDEEQRELLVLKVCLAEIERSRPFLIGLIGDRYGWIPPEERMKAASQEAGYSGELAGKSVTALEIEYGALDRSDQVRRSRFYFRASLPYEEMDAATAADYSDAFSAAPGAKESFDRLRALKARIREKLRDDTERVRTYNAQWDNVSGQVTGLEEWGRQVLEDLWEDLQAEIPEAGGQIVTWQDQERYALEQFLELQCRDFVGREEILTELVNLAMSPSVAAAPWGECVVGASGSGKSALFAQLVRLLRERDILVLAHAAGISPLSTQVDALLRRWTQELSRSLGIADPTEDSSGRDDLEREFARLMSQVSAKQRVVCVIDALDQFEPTPSARHLTWLPRLWPANARLIATTLPGEGDAALERRPGTKVRPLPRLTELEAEQIAATVCKRHHQPVRREVLQVLTAKRDGEAPAAGNPLWLELALEELLLLDADDFARAQRDFKGTPDERLHELRMEIAARLPADIESLYEFLLQRTEEVQGEKRRWARAFANLIAASRSGLREPDLQALLPKEAGEAEDAWDPLRFASVRRSFRAHLVQKGALGQWDFFHAQMRAAVQRRRENLADPSQRKRVHSVIADHLETLSRADPLRQTELMFHYIGADDRLRAAQHYGDGSLSERERSGATQVLAQHLLATAAKEPNAGLQWVCSLLDHGQAGSVRLRQMCQRFNFYLLAAIQHDATLPLQEKLLEAARQRLDELVTSNPGSVSWQRDLAVSHGKLGDLLRARGDLPGAQDAYREDLAILERLVASDRSNTDWQRDLAINHGRMGDLLAARGDLVRAQEAYGKGLAVAERLAASDARNTHWQQDLATSCERLGDLLRARGDLAAVQQAYRKALAIRERLAASDPSNADWQRRLSVSYGRLGDLLKVRGDLAGAQAAYGKDLMIVERLVASDPGNTDWQRDLSVTHGKLGDLLKAGGDLAGAQEAYSKDLAIIELLAGSDPSNTDWQRDLSVTYGKLGDLMKARGDLAGAHEACGRDLAIAERLAVSDPTNIDWQRDLSTSYGKLGDLLTAQGDLAEAQEAYGNCLAIAQRVASFDPGNVDWQRGLSAVHDRLGDLLRARGDLAGAQESYGKSLAVEERMASLDPSNTDWQWGLSISYGKLGDLLRAQGDLARAQEVYDKELAIAERLATSEPSNTDWQRHLSVSHNSQGHLLRARGDLAGAQEAYGKALAIGKRLVATDAENAEWQRGLVVSCYWLGAAFREQGNTNESRRYWDLCRETLRQMQQRGMFLDPPLVKLLKKLGWVEDS